MGWEWPQRCSDLNSMHFSLTGHGSYSPCPADELYCWCCIPAFPPPLRLSVKKQIFCIILGLKGTLPAFMHPKKEATKSKHCDSKIKNPEEKGKWQERVSWSPFMLGSRWGKILRTLFPQKHHGWVKKKIECRRLSTVRGHSYITLKHAKQEYIYIYFMDRKYLVNV